MVLASFPVGNLLLLVPYFFTLRRDVREWQEGGGITAFFPTLIMTVFFYGVYKWVTYWGDHGGFFKWPLFVGVVIVVLSAIRLRVLHLRQQEHAEELKHFDEPPNISGPASKSDFKDWV